MCVPDCTVWKSFKCQVNAPTPPSATAMQMYEYVCHELDHVTQILYQKQKQTCDGVAPVAPSSSVEFVHVKAKKS